MTQCGVHILIGEDAQQHTHVTEEGGDDHTLYDDEFQDAPRFGTDGLTDSELMRTFFDGDEHNVADAHDTRQ